MADFATWVTAAEPALGWTPGTFLEAYFANREEANEAAIDASAVGPAILTFMQERISWEGTAQELLDQLEPDEAGKVSLAALGSAQIRLASAVHSVASPPTCVPRDSSSSFFRGRAAVARSGSREVRHANDSSGRPVTLRRTRTVTRSRLWRPGNAACDARDADDGSAGTAEGGVRMERLRFSDGAQGDLHARPPSGTGRTVTTVTSVTIAPGAVVEADS
jgi:hypothetical protein